ncbi:MAG: hypothetical protein LKJ21_03245 [Oscillospiraceae bacterium]|jgi:hypothetical protein|nr:hypothetical protein [Oscillospiraceae bacterium]MCI1989999.1 hypothetical protein [Oscillospiraceae bacterium]MCI2034829.1 hypothetical protein [Oscillospiraceae bacterium]
MRGYPHAIGTGQDLTNLLALVQAGKLPKADLQDSIAAIEARQTITCPIVSLSADRKTVTLRYCAEAKAGQTAADGVTVSAVQHTGDNPDAMQTVLTLSAALPAGQVSIRIPNPADPLAALGITQTQIDAIKEALAK